MWCCTQPYTGCARWSFACASKQVVHMHVLHSRLQRAKGGGPGGASYALPQHQHTAMRQHTAMQQHQLTPIHTTRFSLGAQLTYSSHGGRPVSVVQYETSACHAHLLPVNVVHSNWGSPLSPCTCANCTVATTAPRTTARRSPGRTHRVKQTSVRCADDSP